MIVYKVNQDNSLSHKEVLNSVDELNTWTNKKQFATIAVESESTGAIRYFTDSGTGYIEIQYNGEQAE